MPSEITVSLLKNAMLRSSSKHFLIDGFPRQMDQALSFEREVRLVSELSVACLILEKICKSRLALFLQCSERTMETRLLKRGETSGRVDDNLVTIHKRFETYRSCTVPVIDLFRREGKLIEVGAMGSFVMFLLTPLPNRWMANHRSPQSTRTSGTRWSIDLVRKCPLYGLELLEKYEDWPYVVLFLVKTKQWFLHTTVCVWRYFHRSSRMCT